MSTRLTQLFRGASLLVPTAVACWCASTVLRRNELDVAVLYGLGPLLALTATALVVRALDMLGRRRGVDAWLTSIDILTTQGCWTIWSSAGAIALAVSVGWASLSVVGVLGLAVVHVSVLWALLRVSGDDPWSVASLTRTFASGRVLEGDAVVERLRFVDPRIPAGFRLFSSGRVGPRWPTSRDVLEAASSEGEVIVERDVGPAVRGVHDAEPVEVWLEDTLGLVHSRLVRVGAGVARLTVLPRGAAVDGARSILSLGGNDKEAKTATRLPTEGSLHLREYRPGDDARRIHWARSLAKRELIVRLPDELPPDLPSVDLVLDTFQVSLADWSGCSEGPHALLDSLVKVWLGVGLALVRSGVNVALVVAGPRGLDDTRTVPLRVPLSVRSFVRAQELGARVCWQDTLSAADLLTSRSIVVSHRESSATATPVTTNAVVVAEYVPRVVVPAALWLPRPAPDFVARSTHALPYPIGSPDNRRSSLRAARARVRHVDELDMLFWVAAERAGRHPRLSSASSSPSATRTLSPNTPRREALPRPFVARPVDASRFRIEALP